MTFLLLVHIHPKKILFIFEGHNFSLEVNCVMLLSVTIESLLKSASPITYLVQVISCQHQPCLNSKQPCSLHGQNLECRFNLSPHFLYYNTRVSSLKIASTFIFNLQIKSYQPPKSPISIFHLMTIACSLDRKPHYIFALKKGFWLIKCNNVCFEIY